VPGTYRLCEINMPAGWAATWSLNGSGITPVNPDLPQDLGRRCYQFTLDPGEVATFSINNFYPLGNPRTIGYWKNWNRCTSGNQAETADKNGGPSNGFYLVEDLLPVLVGDLNLNVTDCARAVMILDKRDISSGDKRANDAAYGLAAQYLAAQLNVGADAVQCTELNVALAAAQELLDSINFTATGGYLGPRTPDKATRSDALSLAATLDSYNNGSLCIVLPP